MILSTPPATAMADLSGDGAGTTDSRSLRSFDRPVLVVVGDEDPITPPLDAEAMTAVAASALSWVSFVTVPRAGHLVPLEQPDEAGAALVALAEAAAR